MIKIVHVIPIARGISKDTLSYFSAQELKPGTIVDVPLRSKTVPALVIESIEGEDIKSDLKNLEWNLKKIESKRFDRFFAESFMQSVADAADYFAATKGSVLSSIVPKTIFQQSVTNIEESEPAKIAHQFKREEQLVLQGTEEERLASHKSLIREEFAKGSSVFFCLPTIEDIRQFTAALPKGIDPYTFILHGNLSNKDIASTWNAALSEKHPILIIGTGQFLCIPRTDIGTIVVERESSRSYKLLGRPHLDIRTFAEFLAKRRGSRLLFADTILRAETIARYKNGELIEFAPLKFRVLSTAEGTIVDMRRTASGEEKEFEVLSPELKELIRENKNRSENLFILSARRGFFPTTACGDCGDIVLCSVCHAPVVLHAATDGKKGNFFLCHKCGERRSADTECKRCGSWKLVTLGIGSARVEDEVKSTFPGIKVFRLDADKAKTPKKAQDIAKEFLAAPGSVLVGTEMALSYIQDAKIAASAVVSIDALLSIPDFRINERVVQLLIAMKRLATRKFLIQTRTDRDTVLKYALQGNLIDFYREEIAERKKFGYPPFSTIIKITFSGEKQKVRDAMQKLAAALSAYNAAAFPALNPSVKGSYTMHVVMKLGRDEWVNKQLLEKLRLLPSHYDIAVDPDTLL